MKIFKLKKTNGCIESKLLDRYEISNFLNQVLCARGITNEEQIKKMFNCGFECVLQNKLKDIDIAANVIKTSVKDKEKICIFGDYDADGVTATALLYLYLKKLGAEVLYHIPKRSDGYGLSKDAILKLFEKGVKLLITVDNGITAIKEVEYANSLGLKVVITDHHRVHGELPKALAVVDPLREDCGSTYKSIAGVGVALKLVLEIEKENGEDAQEKVFDEFLDLAVIGTVGDVVPLEEENRFYVKEGLKRIRESSNLGIKALVNLNLSLGKGITATNIAFSIVPRINAAGRLSSTQKVVKMLTTDLPEVANFIAVELDAENSLRKEIEKEILNRVMAKLGAEPQRLLEKIIIVEEENLHPGVIGIVASRVVEKYNKPAIIITKLDGVARGSARSVEGVSIYHAIECAKPYLLKFGGHTMAAGFDIHLEDIERFKKDVCDYADSLEEENLPTLLIDKELFLEELNIQTTYDIDKLEPFGTGNVEPVFVVAGVILNQVTPVGGGKHLRLEFVKSGRKFNAMKFFTPPDEFFYLPGDVLDIAVTLFRSEYRGSDQLSIYIKELKFYDEDNVATLQERVDYEFYKKAPLFEKVKITSYNLAPSREDITFIYKYLKLTKQKCFDIGVLLHRVNKLRLQINLNKGQEEPSTSAKMGFFKLMLIFDILKELSLMEYSLDADILNLKLHENPAMASLEGSPTYRNLRKNNV